jgi:hypothetical protein
MAVALLAFLLSSCGDASEDKLYKMVEAPKSEAPEKTPEDPRSGLGMKYNGRIGLEIAPGLVMGMDGKIGMGFGL